MNINQLYALFRLHFIPERNKFHSRADFFGITREPSESAEDVWTRILQTEKNCEFHNVTPAELIASKFLSLIGRSTGDYELTKKIRKSDMTIETITDLIHGYMYDRLNDSNNSNDGRDIKHVQERPQKRKWHEKTSYDKNKRRPEYNKERFKDNRCGQCGMPNWTRQHICPAKTVECRNCKKRGHYEKMCRIPKRIQHVDKTTSSAEEDNWDYDKIQRINNSKKKNDYIYVTLLVNNAPIKFIIDSGSPVTLIPKRLFNEITKVEKMNNDYKDVNDNKIYWTNKCNGENKHSHSTTAAINYKSKHSTVNGTRLDETAENNNQLKHRSHQNTQHKNGRK